MRNPFADVRDLISVFTAAVCKVVLISCASIGIPLGVMRLIFWRTKFEFVLNDEAAVSVKSLGFVGVARACRLDRRLGHLTTDFSVGGELGQLCFPLGALGGLFFLVLRLMLGLDEFGMRFIPSDDGDVMRDLIGDFERVVVSWLGGARHDCTSFWSRYFSRSCSRTMIRRPT